MVGINTAIIAGGQGICFAVGIDTAVDVATRLMRDGRVRRAFLGIAAQTVPLDRRLARAHGLAQGTRRAGDARRRRTAPPRSAACGRGDTVLALDGEAVSGVDDLHRLLTAERIGRPLRLDILRRARRDAVTVTPRELA